MQDYGHGMMVFTKDIYVPFIYLLDYSDTSIAPFNILASQSRNQPQTYIF